MSGRGAFAKPMLLGALAALAACALLAVLVFGLQVLPVSDRFADVIVPLVATAVLFAGPWRRAVRRIGQPAESAGRAREVSLWLLGGSMLGALILTQLGLPGVMARLVELDDAAALAGAPRARQVRLRAVAPDYRRCLPVWDAAGPIGQSNYLQVDLYVLCPLPAAGRDAAWMAYRHGRSVKRGQLERDEARRAISEDIANETDERFRAEVPGHIQYFRRLRSERVARVLADALEKEAAPAVHARPAVLLAEMRPYEPGGAGFLVGGAACLLLFAIGVLTVPIAREVEEDREEKPERSPAAPGAGPRRSFELPWSLFIPGRGALATPLLLDINILVFLLMAASGVDPVSPAVEDLLRWGGNQRAALVQHQWWRLVTHQFVHDGAFHIAMNGVLLAMAGMFFEMTASWRWTLATYVIGGAVGGVFSSLHFAGVSVGASGSILAIVGALLVVSYSRYGMGSGLGNWAIGLAVANLLVGLKAGVDGAAHAGGLLGGCILGAAFYVTRVRGEERGRRAAAPPVQPAGYEILDGNAATRTTIEQHPLEGSATAGDLLGRLRAAREAAPARLRLLSVSRPVRDRDEREELVVGPAADGERLGAVYHWGDWTAAPGGPCSAREAEALLAELLAGPPGALFRRLQGGAFGPARVSGPPALGRFLDRFRSRALWSAPPPGARPDR